MANPLFQLEKMKDDLSIKEGEIKLLRENLTRREADLDRLKSEKINQIVQQNKQQTDKEKALQVHIIWLGHVKRYIASDKAHLLLRKHTIFDLIAAPCA